MNPALDLHAERWELVKLATAILQPVLVLVLCAGFVLASAHLLTMLGTRWGKRRVSSKTLAFSLLLHISLACGIVALWPEARTVSAFAATRPDKPQPERFRVETRDEIVQPEPQEQGETPVWEQVPDTIRPPVQRTTAEAQPETEQPLTRPDPLEIATIPAPQMTPLPETEADAPSPIVRTDTGPAEPAAVPLEIQDPQAEMRPEVEAPSTARERSPAVSMTVPRPDDVVRPEAGAVERLTTEPDPSRDTTSVSAPEEEMATLHRADEAADIARLEGPAPSPLMADDAGAASSEATPGASGAPLNPQIARQRTRTPQSVNDSGIERFRPAAVPQNPDTPRDEPVQSLLANSTGESPSMERPELDIPAAGESSRVPAPYRLRTQEQREMATQQYGGTEESERAVDLSLKWLADNQTGAGYWDADAHGGGSINREVAGENGQTQKVGFVGKEADTGVTGLAVLAFLGAGHTYESGEYIDNVERALQWLISQQGRDGSLAGAAGDNDGVYCHGIATFALAEAYALRSNDEAGEWLRLPVQRALQHTLDSRAQDGGWRYQKNQPDGDMSIFGWQLMSLKSAELGGITVPSDVRQEMIKFLIDRSVGQNKGLAGYRRGDQPTAAMTAEALFCKQMLGLTRENPASVEAVGFISRYPPHRSQLNFYYWYYGTLAMFQYGGEPWERWNTALRDLLVEDQRQSGPLAGSWDPRDPWGPYGGRVYSTAVSTLCLEVYYRYLPLYRLGERFDSEP